MNSSFKKIAFCIAALLLSTANSASAFDYPTGIPAAWIAPDIKAPSPPSSWTSEVTNMYYINGSDANCSTKVQFGSVTQPRCTFPYTPIAAGSYLEIHGGPYNYTSKVYLHSQGTEENPVWVVGAKDNLIHLSIVLYGTYIYVDGLNIGNDKGISVRPYRSTQTDHVMVRNTVITGTGSLATGTSGIAATGENGFQLTGMIAYNNTISYLGDSTSDVENDRHALQTGWYIDHVWHLYNTTHHNGGDGVQYSHGGKNAHHFFYGGNTSYDEGENCVDIKVADDVIISENTCYNIVRGATSPGEGMVVHYNPNRIWFINNEIYNTNYGIVSNGAQDVHIIGNNIHQINELEAESHSDISSYQSGAAIQVSSTDKVYISNNTITDAVRGIGYQGLQDRGYQVSITSNVISDLRYGAHTGNSPYAIMLKQDGGSQVIDDAIVENNLFFNPMKVYLGKTLHTSLASMMAIGKCNNNEGSCLVADPKFAGVKDFSLTAGSPAIDVGSIATSYAIYQSYYDIALATDIVGNVRPIDSAEWDIGAFEFGATAGGGSGGGNLGTPPASPTIISIQSVE